MYKNFTKFFCTPQGYIRKFLLIMKITTILMFATLMQVSATGLAQRITLNQKFTTLKRVFNEINKQTGYNILWSAKKVKNTQVVNVNFENISLREALNRCLDGFPLTYTIENNVIVIREKEKTLADKIVDYFKVIDLTGRITDLNGAPLPGASVMVKGSTLSATADANGDYQIRVPDNDAILIFKYVGFLSQEVKVDGRTKINVQLKEDQQLLTEVAVVGYGTVKKVNLTGSLSILDMSTRENRPLTNASQALQGVSGLWVNQAGGKPGQDGGSIRIRGIGSIGSSGKSDPLVLVDGIEYNINEINPDFIETITVLKDASAAIYGSRAANGVILVTTKTGKKGKTEINYNFSYGIQEATALPDVLWDPIQYMELKNQALINEGKSAASVDYSAAQIAEYKNGMASNPIAYPNLNWFDLVLKNGYIQQHNLRFSGGNDNVLYNIGLGYMDQDGILIDANHANRYTLNANVSANVTQKLRIGTNIVGNYRTYTEPAFGGTSGTATSYYFTRLTRVLPIFTPYTTDGRYGSVVFPTPGRNTIENPLMLLKEGRNVRTPQRVLAKVFADYELPFNLKYSINFGVDRLDGYASVFTPYLVSYHPITGAPNNYNVNPSSYEYNENEVNTSFYHTLDWKKVFAEKHALNAVIGGSFNNFYRKSFSGQIEGYFDNTLTDLSAGSVNPATSGTRTKDVLASYFGRLNYSFADKYLVEAVVRYDGSSRFSEGNKWGAFPSVSAAWRIDQEQFFKNMPSINQLKLRASWGKLGNQAVELYSYLNSVRLGADYSFNNVISPGSSVNAYNDPAISWETTTTTNLGVDLEAWKGLLGITFDVFKRRTTGILRPVNIPYQVGGLTGPQKNVGVVDNAGFDLNLSHRNTINDFSYSFTGGVSYVKNKVVDLKGETIISGRRIIKEGYPIDSYYIYQADGIYQNQQEVDNSPKVSTGVRPGYLKYKDINGDNKIDGNDRVITGRSNPQFTYSFNLNLGYKNFSLTSFFQGIQGIDLYPTVNLAQPFNNGAGVTREWATDAWTPGNPGARLPILTTATGAPEMYSTANSSSFWLQDGSYLRLKSLQLKYDFKQNWVSKLSLNKVALFVNAENLVTFTSFKGFDPEKDIKSDNFYEYPTLKTFSFGINATF
ncbi:TonB-dependent receptor plug [Pedobacter heparinus DSM 2366]|uniref:TonB-dependent receptor plug n=2 Tax=Pedobacter heparinus TaxID=984 RepID=C6XXS5_PEDHD|nr:TonB-dependent receptor plug [Pedobacter heparinus DSM 2366]